MPLPCGVLDLVVGDNWTSRHLQTPSVVEHWPAQDHGIPRLTWWIDQKKIWITLPCLTLSPIVNLFHQDEQRIAGQGRGPGRQGKLIYDYREGISDVQVGLGERTRLGVVNDPLGQPSHDRQWKLFACKVGTYVRTDRHKDGQATRFCFRTKGRTDTQRTLKDVFWVIHICG